MSGIDKTILEEILRYKNINNYIFEQDAMAPAPEGDVPPAPDAGALPPSPDAGMDTATPPPTAEPIDVASDPDVEKVGEEENESEELEITDLVNSQKNIETKQEEYFNNLFNQLNGLESKLKDMEGIFTKLNDIEAKIEKYREKTPQEKLELRSLDSGPFNQKLSDFFVDKEQEMEKSGKNEYVLTTDEVKQFSPGQIEDSFNEYGQDDDDMM
jgi:hypothetical protein